MKTLRAILFMLVLLGNLGISTSTANESKVKQSDHAVVVTQGLNTVAKVFPQSAIPGSTIWIQGAGFAPTSTVSIAGQIVPPSNITYVALSQLSVKIPLGSHIGLANVTVTTGLSTTVSGSLNVLTKTLPQIYLDQTPERLPNQAMTTGSAIFLDIDNDGDLDLITVNTLLPENRLFHIFINDGAGNFTDETSLRTPDINESSQYIEGGDIDGDGDIDLLSSGVLLINNGAGYFTDEWHTRMPNGGMLQCYGPGTFGDVDGDGDLDLFIGCGEGQLFLNDGRGYFTDVSSELLPPPNGWGGLRYGVFADLDGDGDLDLLIAWRTGNANTGAYLLYINDGNGHFTDQTEERMPHSQGVQGVQAVVADLDGDGDLDAIIVNGWTDFDYLLINDGSGHFSSMAGLPAALVSDRIALGDVDGDGDIDIVTTNLVAGQNVLLINDGKAHFSIASSTQLPGRDACLDYGGNQICSNVSLGDIDNDGALDIFFARVGGIDMVQQNSLFTNRWLKHQIFLPVTLKYLNK